MDIMSLPIDVEEKTVLREHQRTVMEAMDKSELIDIIFEGEDEIERLSTRAGVLLAKIRYIENICEAIK